MKFMIYKGKKYILKNATHNKGTDKLYLKPFDEEKYNAVVDEIAEKVENAVDKRTLIKQALSPLEYDEIEKILKTLRRGAKVKSKEGCYEIKVGKHYIPVVG